jgi:Uma2 family endonuclease
MTLIGLLLIKILPDGTRREWFAGGATLVWLIDPKRRIVEVWRREGLVQTLHDDDTLQGEEVLPGFAFPVRELWE